MHTLPAAAGVNTAAALTRHEYPTCHHISMHPPPSAHRHASTLLQQATKACSATCSIKKSTFTAFNTSVDQAATLPPDTSQLPQASAPLQLSRLSAALSWLYLWDPPAEGSTGGTWLRLNQRMPQRTVEMSAKKPEPRGTCTQPHIASYHQALLTAASSPQVCLPVEQA